MDAIERSMLGLYRRIRNRIRRDHLYEEIRYQREQAALRGFDVRAVDGFLDVSPAGSAKIIRISSQNAVYTQDMVAYFDYYFESALPIRLRLDGRWCEVVDFSTPRFQMVRGFDDFPILCSSVTEPYVTAQQYLDFAALRAGEVVLDLGSYSCLTSIAFSKAVGPSGRVLAVEPDPGNHACCLVNIAQHERSNGLSNIRLMHAAVAGHDGTLSFSAEGSMGSAAVSVVGQGRGDVVDVPCRTLATLVESENLKRLDFIKIDIEGFEAPAIAGARNVLDRFKPRMMIEPHMVEEQLSSVAVVEALSDLGYECVEIRQTGVDLPLIAATPRI